ATSGLKSNGSSQPLAQPPFDLWVPGFNGWDTAHTDWNNGAMDSFDKGEFPIVPLISPGAYCTYAPANGQAGGPANYYWELAQALPNELEAAGLTWFYYSEDSSSPLGAFADKLEDQGIGVSAIEALRNARDFATSYVETVKDFDQSFGAQLAAGAVGNVTW